MKTLKIACEGAALADIDELHALQNDLKKMSPEDEARLRQEIEKTGYAFPVRVWLDKSKKKMRIVGGHQTTSMLQKMRAEGWVIPKIPVSFVHAKDMKEAKRRVLQDISQYGRIKSQSLQEFMAGASLSYEDFFSSFNIPDFDMASFEDEFFPDETAPKPLSEGQDKVTSGEVPAGSVTKIILFYSVSEYPQIVKMASEVGQKLGCSNLSQLFAALLKKESKQK